MARWARVIVTTVTGQQLTYTDVDEVDPGSDRHAGANRGHLKLKRTSPTTALLADLTAGSMLWVCVENPPV